MRNSPLQWALAVVAILIVYKLVTTPLVGSRPAPFKSAIAQLGDFRAALEMFKEDNGFFPSGTNVLNDLVKRPTNASPAWHQYLDKIPPDPWGHAYRYEYPGKHNTNSFDLSSAGPDGVFGTADDIGNWE